jgi:hypothetical protein
LLSLLLFGLLPRLFFCLLHRLFFGKTLGLGFSPDPFFLGLLSSSFFVLLLDSSCATLSD